MKLFFISVIALSCILFGCKKEMDSQEPNPSNPKGTPVYKDLPKPICSLTAHVAEPGEAEINRALYSVFHAYMMSYVTSPSLRGLCENLFGKGRRNIPLAHLIAGNEALFFGELAKNAFRDKADCQDLACVNDMLSYKGYDYEVAVTYFNRANPEAGFGDAILLALGQDFSYPTDEYEDVIPAVLLDFTDDATRKIREVALSETDAHSVPMPVLVFNLADAGEPLDDLMPVYGRANAPGPVVEKSPYFTLSAISLKANQAFENDNYSEFLVHQMHNYCCSNVWGPDYSRTEKDEHYKVHKSKIGQELSVDWPLWHYVDYANYGQEHWWSKLAFYEWDWWAIGKNTCISLPGGEGCVPWQIQARFKHEWYLALNTFKNDEMFTSGNPTLYLTTPNGHVYLTRN